MIIYWSCACVDKNESTHIYSYEQDQYIAVIIVFYDMSAIKRGEQIRKVQNKWVAGQSHDMK